MNMAIGFNPAGPDNLDVEGWWNVDPNPGNVNFYYNLYDDASFEWLSFAEDRYPSSNFYYGAYPDWRYDRFAYFPPFNWQPGEGIRVRSEESFALLEVPRRKLIVEASYPVSHTTSWEVAEERRHVQFQEFKVVPKLSGACEVNTGEMQFSEKIYSGARVFLDNHGTLALKKLFEGQLQALRIDVLEEIEDDNDVRTRQPIKLLKNGFMYLKWLFTKETV